VIHMPIYAASESAFAPALRRGVKCGHVGRRKTSITVALRGLGNDQKYWSRFCGSRKHRASNRIFLIREGASGGC
jgi:hypothetical protein